MTDEQYEKIKDETVAACEKAINIAAGETTGHDLATLSVGLLGTLCALQVRIFGELREIKKQILVK